MSKRSPSAQPLHGQGTKPPRPARRIGWKAGTPALSEAVSWSLFVRRCRRPAFVLRYLNQLVAPVGHASIVGPLLGLELPPRIGEGIAPPGRSPRGPPRSPVRGPADRIGGGHRAGLIAARSVVLSGDLGRDVRLEPHVRRAAGEYECDRDHKEGTPHAARWFKSHTRERCEVGGTPLARPLVTTFGEGG